MTDMIDLNGDFVICERVDSESLKKDSGIFIYNKENVPVYKITGKHLSEKVDFPFEVGDKVCSASTGTVVNLGGQKTWLFRPEHILAKFV